jgi:Flp pilus assembly protein TadD
LGILYKKRGKVKEAKNEILKAKELFANQGRFDEVRKCDEVLKDL